MGDSSHPNEGRYGFSEGCPEGEAQGTSRGKAMPSRAWVGGVTFFLKDHFTPSQFKCDSVVTPSQFKCDSLGTPSQFKYDGVVLIFRSKFHPASVARRLLKNKSKTTLLTARGTKLKCSVNCAFYILN